MLLFYCFCQGYNSIAISSSLRSGMIIASMVIAAVVFCYACTVCFNRSSPLIQQASFPLTILLCIGIIFFLATIPLLSYVEDSTCHSFIIVGSIGYIAMLTSLYIKMDKCLQKYRMMLLGTATQKSDLRVLKPYLCYIGVEVVFNIVWISAARSTVSIYPSMNNDIVTYETCSGHSYGIWGAVALVLKAVYTLYGLYIATAHRNVLDAFREPRLISATIFNIVLCDAVCIPLLVLFGSSDSVDAIYAIEVFGILWSSFGTAVLMFSQRVYYLYKPPAEEFYDLRAKLAVLKETSSTHSRSGTTKSPISSSANSRRKL